MEIQNSQKVLLKIYIFKIFKEYWEHIMFDQTRTFIWIISFLFYIQNFVNFSISAALERKPSSFSAYLIFIAKYSKFDKTEY